MAMERGRSDPCLAMLLTSCFFSLLLLRSRAALPADRARGIAPNDVAYFQDDEIYCKDQSKAFPQSWLNDDYCDCPDGTDEPGTSACPEGRFYCSNVGDAPKTLFSSRVNDGICDCCDGSDEYDGKTNCPDSCWEAGKQAREKLSAKLAIFKEGAALRAKDIEKSKQVLKEEEGRLATLRKDEKTYKNMVDKLKVQVDAIEEAERLERERKEKEESQKARDNETSSDGSQSSAAAHVEDAAATVVEEDPGNKAIEGHSGPAAEEPVEPIEEAKEPPESHSSEEKEAQEEEDSQELSKEELGKLVASRWTGEKDTVTKDEDVNQEDKDEDDDDTYSSADSSEEYADDDADDRYESNGTHESSYDPELDIPEQSAQNTSWWRSLREAPGALLKLIGFNRVHVNISDAERIRNEYHETNRKLSDVRSKIEELETKLKQDFGKELQFFSLHGKCFEKEQNKYVYEMCFFKDATQKEGYTSTSLGSWNGLKDDYRYAEFKNGQHCWNGPDRSLTVRLKCGVKSELSEVEEPSRCEYTATFSTPAQCLEERVKAMEARLDGLNAGAADIHEEL